MLALILLISGCTNQNEAGYRQFSDGTISFYYPDWPGSPMNDPAMFMLQVKDPCVFSASSYPVASLPLRQELGKRFNAVFEESGGCYQSSYIMEAGGVKYNTKTRLLYCDYQTYALTMACRGQAPQNPEVWDLSCEYDSTKSLNKKTGLGLFPIPRNDNSSLITDAIKESRHLGADVLPWYFAWKDLGTSWTTGDFLMEPLSYEGRTAISVNIIHSNVLGGYPQGFTHFSDPGFKEAFANFSIEFIRRYRPDYYLIGGEIDIYLSQQRSEIPAFKTLLEYTYREIKKAEPSQTVGFVTSYHDAVKNNATDIIMTMEPYSDIVVFTIHSYEGQFDYSNVSRGLMQLKAANAFFPSASKRYAIIENGWSSSPMLGSSEAKQAQFARDFFSFLDSPDTRAEFVTWFGLYEWSNCTQSAETFLAPIPKESRDPVFVQRFEEFMCSLGLKRHDGTPKEAFNVWKG